MTFGLSEKTRKMMIEALERHKEIQKAVVFGSRAMGNYKNGSDVDLALYGPSITQNTVNQLSTVLNEELPLPYYFDIIHYESISSKPFKEHIDTVSRLFFER